MERHSLTITRDKEVYEFEISDYPHHEHDSCKFEVYKNGSFVAGFTPDSRHILHLCDNTGTVPEEVLHILADEIEKHHWV